ncbi:MAG: SbcC/MukB-like Walker B domain-containing protein, partial [Candidatus Nanopelagicales bacterium]
VARKTVAVGGISAAASAALAQAEALVNADAERVAQEEAALRETVGGDGTATDLLEAARIAAGAIDTALDAAEAAAAHAGCDGISDLQMRARTARESATALGEQLERAREDHARLSATRDAVQALAEQWRAAHADVAGILAATDTAVSLGQLVSAQSKANTRRLTLQSYAVQRRFRTVLDAATLHLERMSGSHFAFELDESVGRGQSGLGIAMRDQWSGALRDPKALSGGETFIASLALALGLADVVREENGGVDLQTLFVDEGFGSLDQDSLQQVLDQLDALRSRGRVVGVISHVTEMKDWVHDRVIVTPGTPGEGSRLHQPT